VKSNLGDIILSVLNGRCTGQLAITVRGLSHHCKIFFENGEVCQIVCGRQHDSDCIDILVANDLADCFFIPNLKTVSTPRTTLSGEQVASRLKERYVNADIRSIQDGRTSHPVSAKQGAAVSTPVNASDYPKIIEGIKVALLRQIGPVGSRVMGRVMEQKWRIVSPTKDDLKTLVDLLKEEIDDEESRNDFLSETKKFL
jgi:hypothetical protein